MCVLKSMNTLNRDLIIFNLVLSFIFVEESIFYVDTHVFNLKFSFSVSESLISLSMHCFIYLTNRSRGHRCMVIGLATVFVITAFVITAYHYWSSEFKFRSWRGVLDTTLCDKVCQWLATGWCVFSAYSGFLYQ